MSVLGRFCLAFATLLCGCDSLFGAFLGDNSRSCAVNPSICSAAQVCDPVLHQCQDITPGPRDGGMDLAHGGGDLGSACAGPGTCASGQWCSPLSNLCEKAPTLYSVSGNGSGTVWAVGDNGLVVVWDNSTTPVYLHSNTAVALRGVSAIAGTKQAWIVGDMGTILQATATQVMPATTFGTTTNSLRGVWTRSPQSAVAVGLTQATARYDANLDPNHLQTWTNVGGGPNADFFAIGGCDKPTPGIFPFLRALGANGQIFKWGGTSWNTSSEATMTVKQLLGTTCFAANDVWAVGVGLTIIHYDGTTWSTSPAPGVTPQNLSGLSGSSTDDVWAVGDANTALSWDSADAQWVAMPCAVCRTSDYWSVWAGSISESVWVTGTNGAVSVWNRNNSVWKDMSLPL